MKKRCIWNWDHGKKIEYLEEKGKKAKFETIFGIGIASVVGIFFGVLPLIVIFYYIFEIFSIYFLFFSIESFHQEHIFHTLSFFFS